MKAEVFPVAMAIGDIVLKSTLLLALAWGVTRLARRASAAMRHMIWLLALGSILCVPALELIAPRNVIFSLAPPQVAPGPIVSPMQTEPIDLSAIPNDLPIDSAPVPSVDIGVSASPTPAPPASPRTLVTFAGMAWGGGGLIVLLTTALGWAALRRIRAYAYDLPPAFPIDSCVRGVKLLLSLENRPPSALTWGALQPTILLPKSAESWSDHRLHTVLMHEFEHVRRQDAAKQIVGVLACALYWFNPLVWLAAKAARAEAEAATDDAVLRAGVKPSSYANTLMEVAAEIGSQRRLKISAGVAYMKHSKIEARVRAILDTRIRRGVTRWETIAATAVAFSALGSLSVVRAIAARPFADLPSVAAQEVVIHQQTAAEKHAAAEHARHLKAIAAKLEARRKEYDKAVLRVQHLQANMEGLEQKLGKTKTKVAYWNLQGAKLPMQTQQALELKQLAEVKAQLGEAQQAKTRAILAEKDARVAQSQKITAEMAARLEVLSSEDRVRVGAKIQQVDAASLADLTKLKIVQARVEAVRAQDARSAARASIDAQVAQRSKQKAEAKQDDARARIEIAQAVAQAEVQSKVDKQSADAQLEKAQLRVLEAKADAKERANLVVLDIHEATKAGKDARSRALKAVAEKKQLEHEDYKRALMGRYKILRMRQGTSDGPARIRELKAKIGSGKLKGAELKRAKLELEKLQLLVRLNELEKELGDSQKK